MRPVLVIIAVIAALVGTAAVGGLYRISARVTEALIAEELRAWTGGEVHLQGTPTATVRPSPGFVVKNVVVDWPGNAGRGVARQLAVEEITASLRILPLLAGRFEVDLLTLHKPHLALAAGRRAEDGPARAPQQAFRPQAGKAGTIVLHDGSISLDAHPHDGAPAVSSVNLRLTSATDAAHMTVSGQFDLRDWTVYLDGALADPASVFTPQGSEGYLEVAAGYRASATAARKDGKAVSGEDGSFAQTTRRVAERTGLARILPRSIGPMRVEGTFSVDDRRLALADASLAFGRMHARGGLTLAFDNDRTIVENMMALRPDALASYASFLDDATPEELATMPVSVGWLRDLRLTFDGRFDAYRVRGIPVEYSDLSLRAQDGTIRIGVAAAGPEEGRGQAEIVVRPAGEGREPGVTVELAGRFADASLDMAAAAIWARRSNPMIGTERPPTGAGAGRFEMSATGKTPRELLDSLAGSVRLDVRDGSIDGADIVATLEGLRKGGHVMSADDGAFIPIAGRTYFDRLQAKVDFAEGVARCKGRIVGDAYEIELAGGMKLRGGELSGGGMVSLFGTEDMGADARRRLVALPFGVGGVLRAPVLAPGVPTVTAPWDRAENIRRRA